MKRFPISLLRHLTAVFLLGALPLSAQNSTPQMPNNVVYGEALGVGGYYSLNYERVLFRALNKKMMVSASGGGCYYYKPLDLQEYYFLERIMMAYGGKRWFLEVGGNLILYYGRSYSFRDYWMGWNSAGTFFPHIGLRFQSLSPGLFAKAYIFPIRNECCYNDFFISLIDKPWHGPEWYWWGGVAIGYAF